MRDSVRQPSSVSSETRQIQRISLSAFLINLGLAGLKIILALSSGSLAIMAGAIDSATDSVASLAVYGGVRLSSKKTASFPLGLYKIENLISIGIAFFIFFAGYEIVRQTFSSSQTVPDVSLTTLLLLCLTLGIILWFGQYALQTGRKTGSPTLIAEGRHRQVDALSSLVVIASAALNFFGFHLAFLGISIDRFAAVLVVLFILRAGWELLRDGMRVLLDASLDRETLEEAKRLILKEPLVTRVKSLVGRNAGRFRFIQTHVVVRTEDLKKAHQASGRIEQRIRDELAHVERVLVHFEPQTRQRIRLALPLADLDGRLSRHFGEAPYFALADLDLAEGRSLQRSIHDNAFVDQQRGKGLRVAEWLVEHKVDQILVTEDIKHKGPGYVFANAGVAVNITDEEQLETALDVFLHKQQPRKSHDRHDTPYSGDG